MTARKNESGQAIVLTVLALIVLLGMAAFVLDAGAWFRTDRRLQGTADAAALAGAQDLPLNPALAIANAHDYAEKNGGDVALDDIQIETTFSNGDTISVKAEKEEPGIFSRVFGIGKTKISASAKARVDVPAQARWVAPMVVHCNHPLIKKCHQSANLPTFFEPTTMEYDPMGAPGAFGMLNLGKHGGDDDDGGTPGTSEQAEWILRGFDKYLGVDQFYKSNPGAKFSSQEIRGALDARVCDAADLDCPALLFPVFESLEGQGSNAEYYIIGWIGFRLVDYQVHGHGATLTGYFTEFIANGILSATGSGSTNFGVKSIQLIE
jgi:hypothetical protein